MRVTIGTDIEGVAGVVTFYVQTVRYRATEIRDIIYA